MNQQMIRQFTGRLKVRFEEKEVDSVMELDEAKGNEIDEKETSEGSDGSLGFVSREQDS